MTLNFCFPSERGCALCVKIVRCFDLAWFCIRVFLQKKTVACINSTSLLLPLCTKFSVVTKMTSRARLNYHDESEAGINKQVNIELYAHYSYLALAAFYDRDDVALKGFHKFFLDAAKEEKGHAEKLVEYQNLRGGRIVFQPIEAPAQQSWESPLAALEYAFNMEKQVNQALLDLHQIATKHNDPHLTNYLEEEFLKEQAEALNKLSKQITNLQRVGDGLGVYLFDKDIDSLH